MLAPTHHDTRGQSKTLRLTTDRQKLLSQRSVSDCTDWNQLPQSVVDATSVNVFKTIYGTIRAFKAFSFSSPSMAVILQLVQVGLGQQIQGATAVDLLNIDYMKQKRRASNAELANIQLQQQQRLSITSVARKRS